MSLRPACFSLLLVLVSAWANDLRAGTFVAASTSSTPVFGQEVYPFSLREKAHICNLLEHQIVPPAHFAALETEAMHAVPLLLPSDETAQHVFHSTDLCYRLECLRC